MVDINAEPGRLRKPKDHAPCCKVHAMGEPRDDSSEMRYLRQAEGMEPGHFQVDCRKTLSERYYCNS